MKEYLRIFEDAAVNDEGHAYLLRAGSLDSFMRELRGLLTEDNIMPFDELMRAMEGRAGLKRKDLFMVLRILFTGRKSGPPLKDIFHLIQKDIIIERIDRYLKDVSGKEIKG
jgi:glutamyl/glutaminyl-tRNA synthetase